MASRARSFGAWALPFALAAACASADDAEGPSHDASGGDENDAGAAALDVPSGGGGGGESLARGGSPARGGGSHAHGGAGTAPLGGAALAADAGEEGARRGAAAGEGGGFWLPPETGSDELVIGFEDAAEGPLDASYAGVTWEGGWQVSAGEASLYRPHIGAQLATGHSASSALSFSFERPIHFMGAWFSHQSGATVQLEAFDEDGVLLDQSTVLTQSLTPKLLSFHANYAKTIRVSWTGAGFSMDDVTYLEYEP